MVVRSGRAVATCRRSGSRERSSRTGSARSRALLLTELPHRTMSAGHRSLFGKRPGLAVATRCGRVDIVITLPSKARRARSRRGCGKRPCGADLAGRAGRAVVIVRPSHAVATCCGSWGRVCARVTLSARCLALIAIRLAGWAQFARHGIVCRPRSNGACTARSSSVLVGIGPARSAGGT